MIYLVDGETEEAFLTVFKRYKIISKSGPVHKICLPLTSPPDFSKKIKLILKSKDQVVVITDADSFSNKKSFAKLLENLKILKNNKYVSKIHLVLQYNLEDELCDSLNLSKKKLYSHFGVAGNRELKNTVCSLKPEALFKKIKDLPETHFWSCEYHRVSDEVTLSQIEMWFCRIFDL